MTIIPTGADSNQAPAALRRGDSVRTYIIFVLLLVMIVGFGVLLGIRSRPDHEMLGVVATASAVTEADASATDASPSKASKIPDSRPDGATSPEKRPDGAGTKNQAGLPAKQLSSPAGDAGHRSAQDAALTPDAASARLMDRPLRVIGLGWEVIAPGLVANRGTTPGENSQYTKAGLEVHLRSTAKVVDLERALARGGADEEGADVAIMPLPVFVASYEQLRALSPKVFFVLGWSHGQEALLSFRDNVLLNLQGNRNVQLLAERGTSSHFFGLFVLDLAGVSPDRVEEVDRGSRLANSIDLAALRQAARGQPAGAASRRFVLTTADANRLVPYVAIAPAGLVDSEADALRLLCSQWLSGVDELRRDVPAAARRIASIRGAPEALELLGLMGRVESTTLRENAQMAGLSGRDAVTLDSLIEETWRVWRGADVVTSPLPDELLVDTDVIAAMVRAGSTMTGGAGGTLGDSERPHRAASGSNAPQPLIVHRIQNRRFENEHLVARIGFLGGIFRPLPLRVAIPGRDRSRATLIVEAARARFGLPEGRLSVARRVTGRAAPAAIELLPPM